MDLSGKIVAVAGATGGIGSSLVKELAKEGVSLVLIGRDEEKLKALVKDLAGKNHKTYSADFTDKASFEKIAKEIESDFEKIDVLINAAGLGIYKAIEDVTFEDWEASFAIGVTGPYFLTKYLLPLTKKSEGSLVLNIGSGAGTIPMAGRSVYNVQKYALRGMTLSLAEEFKRTKTSFCLVSLGSVLTEFGPMTLEEKKNEMEEGKAYFTPEWVAKKIVEVVKEEKRETEYTFYPSEYVGGSWKRPGEE